MKNHWKVQYSRFLCYPSLSSTHPSLVPLRYLRGRGNWISSSSFTASLKLFTDSSSSMSMLTITFRNQVLEEHYILNLHVTWPQVSCVSGYPARGSRVVFLSYKDHVDEIQKFALRFLTSCETESFISSLKDNLGDFRASVLSSDTLKSETSSESEFVPSNQPLSSPTEDSVTPTAYCPDLIPISNNHVTEYYNPVHEVTLNSDSDGTMCNYNPDRMLTAFPPSFTSLLQNCCPEPGQGISQPSVTQEISLKDEFAKYLQDSSFHDVLSKVEQIIGEMGDDLLI